MRVLYIGSNPDGQETLELQREITALQGRFATVSGEPVNFVFLPSATIEGLAGNIAQHRPDVLHISSHGNADSLTLANEAGRDVRVTADMLSSFLDEEARPKLIYLNSCDSEAIAKELTSMVGMAIGTTAAITNRAARSGAVTFYERLLQGRTVESAFRASSAVIAALQNAEAQSKLFCQPGLDPATQILHQIPRIVARFANERYTQKNRDGDFDIEVGVFGCPRATNQLVIFTDDHGFLDEDLKKRDEAADLCSVVTTLPVRGELWGDTWTTHGDFKIYACGVTTQDDHFVAASMVCDALEAFYKLKFRDPSLTKLPAAARAAINHLRTMEGQKVWAAITDATPAAASAPSDPGTAKRLGPRRKRTASRRPPPAAQRRKTLRR